MNLCWGDKEDSVPSGGYIIAYPIEGRDVRDVAFVDDGALCLIDFTQRFDRASTLVERVYKAWFGLDGVYFNRDQVDYVAARTAPEYYAEARSRVPYTPWYPTRYLFAGRKEA